MYERAKTKSAVDGSELRDITAKVSLSVGTGSKRNTVSAQDLEHGSYRTSCYICMGNGNGILGENLPWSRSPASTCQVYFVDGYTEAKQRRGRYV